MVTKLDQYTESPEIDIEKIKAIANSLSDSDTIVQRLTILSELSKLIHKEVWRLTGILIKQRRFKEAVIKRGTGGDRTNAY